VAKAGVDGGDTAHEDGTAQHEEGEKGEVAGSAGGGRDVVRTLALHRVVVVEPDHLLRGTE
jgi:hypothetical protein